MQSQKFAQTETIHVLKNRFSRNRNNKDATCFLFVNTNDNDTLSQSSVTRKCITHHSIDHQNNQVVKNVMAQYLKLQTLIQFDYIELNWYAQNLPEKLQQVDAKQLQALGSKYQFFLRRNIKDTQKLKHLKDLYSQIEQIVNTKYILLQLSQSVINQQIKIEQLTTFLRQEQPKLAYKLTSVGILSQKRKEIQKNRNTMFQQISLLRDQYFSLQRQLKQCQKDFQKKQKLNLKKSVQEIMKKIFVKQKSQLSFRKQTKNCNTQNQKSFLKQQTKSRLGNNENSEIIQHWKSTQIFSSSNNQPFSRQNLATKRHLNSNTKDIKTINYIFQSTQNLKEVFLSCVQQMKNIKPNVQVKAPESKEKDVQINGYFLKSPKSSKKRVMHKYSISNFQKSKNLYKRRREVFDQLFKQKCPNSSRQVRAQFIDFKRKHKRIGSENQLINIIINQNNFRGSFDKKKRLNYFNSQTSRRNLNSQIRNSQIIIDANMIQSFTESKKFRQQFRKMESIQVLKKIIQKDKVSEI